MPTKERLKPPGTDGRRPATLAELQRSRELVALSPGGHYFKIRPFSVEDYALAGGLPGRLLAIASGGADAINQEIERVAGDASGLDESAREARGFFAGLVKRLVIEPDLSAVEEPSQVMLPVDFKWLVNIALMEEDRDGEGRRLWGREPLSAFRLFRQEHRCAEDCESCGRVVEAFSAPVG